MDSWSRDSRPGIVIPDTVVLRTVILERSSSDNRPETVVQRLSFLGQYLQRLLFWDSHSRGCCSGHNRSGLSSWVQYILGLSFSDGGSRKCILIKPCNNQHRKLLRFAWNVYQWFLVLLTKLKVLAWFCMNCGFASALWSRMLAHCEGLGLVNLPRLVGPGDQTGAISKNSIVVWLGPIVQVRVPVQAMVEHRLCRLLFSCGLVRLPCG